MADHRTKKRRSQGTGSIFRRDNGTYYFEYHDQRTGRAVKKSLRTKNRATAEENARTFTRAMEAEDKEEVLVQIAKARNLIKSRDLPLADVWQAFTDTGPTASAGTLKNYCRSLDDFITWMQTNRPAVESFAQIDQSTAMEYLDALWATGISGSTYNYRRNALGLITKKLEAAYHLDGNPWHIAALRKDEAKQTRMALTSKQVSDFLKLFDDPKKVIQHREEMRVLALICVYAGTRLIDAALIRWTSVDLAAGRIRYTPRKTARKAKEAMVPILPPLRTALEALQATRTSEDGYVLATVSEIYQRNPDGIQKPLVELVQAVTGDGREHNGDTAQRKVQRAAYGAHSLRHTFASMAAMAGVKAAYLGRMLGDNITTVQKYYVSVGYAVNLLPGFDTMPKMIEAKTQTEPERAALHRLADELPLEKIQQILKTLERGKR